MRSLEAIDADINDVEGEAALAGFYGNDAIIPLLQARYEKLLLERESAQNGRHTQPDMTDNDQMRSAGNGQSEQNQPTDA